eukprot:CAMPEP_0172633998 /NCGR_PEP_ID=MMETSP1068-20121228/192322_1 /TAXON_ID=35684 /ORGANISM="Pseudopedinella elastica, Strain CCMP716" /LENGTH=102 /DNA_ID=CAMNT_0013445845 /DNA_START=99 /DNA_END=404 /DNA_ORIENTATION=-
MPANINDDDGDESAESSTTTKKASSRSPIKQSEINKNYPYHGAPEVLSVVRKIIAATPPGSKTPMSATMMAEKLEAEHGLSRAMARRLFSQVRKGASLHLEW